MKPPRAPILEQDDAYEHPGTYRVFVEDEFRFGYDPAAFPTLRDVLDHILGHVSALRADGLRKWDLAVWKECRLMAVILTRGDGEPAVHILAGGPERVG